MEPDETTDNSETFGYTFKSKNTEDLQDKLEFLINQPEAVIKMASKDTTEYVHSYYNWDMIADQTEAVYRELISE